MNHDRYSDSYLRRVLTETRTIALVGASDNWKRPSFFVMKYLQSKGYRVRPVNPKLAEQGTEVLGERAFSSLADTPLPFEMVDIFRNSEAAGEIVDAAIELRQKQEANRQPPIRFIWMQLGVRNDAAAARAEEAGLEVVMDRCPKIEWSRLHSELAWSGVNTGVVSARRPRLVLER